MLPKLFKTPWIISALCGVLVFLSFETFNLPLLALVFPILFNRLSFENFTLKKSFALGFLTSLIIMLGGFYWVTYVIHEFGYLPWWLSFLIFLAFCGFGALNFPIFFTAANFLHQRIAPHKRSSYFLSFWFSLFLPALFSTVEYFFPKIFPWYLGHCLYKATYLTQIIEYTGSLFLSFMIYSLGSSIGLILLPPIPLNRRPWESLLVPLSLVFLSLGFSQYRMAHPPMAGKTLKVALIQANIGSLEKVNAEMRVGNLIDQVVGKYHSLTETALKSKPDLILWPETAMPFTMGNSQSRFEALKAQVLQWGTPLITGSYAKSERSSFKDYNGAFLLQPESNGSVSIQSYMKNILLAFGEYFPMGEYFPIIYRYFPQVADFERGNQQEPVTLNDGTKLGLTICYEAIVPSFFRKTASHPIHAVVNLTNDSWFGPTSEPFLHGSLSVFRSIETKLPLIRVTNTGISFTVDSLGNRSPVTSVYSPEVLISEVKLPDVPPTTFYTRHGDWLVLVLTTVLLLFGFLLFFERD
ncbi:MAG: apolipoprotein N-acyltransferase [Proteobacteria bacterium]|nr:apolipoprotein N-acyltransferase [Pseudomonadota bacterium]